MKINGTPAAEVITTAVGASAAAAATAAAGAAAAAAGGQQQQWQQQQQGQQGQQQQQIDDKTTAFRYSSNHFADALRSTRSRSNHRERVGYCLDMMTMEMMLPQPLEQLPAMMRGCQRWVVLHPVVLHT